ncbi:MAG: hypothetical protein J5706_02650, partial [Elusimicrobiales bacterium]|nr:hypothetical protein [Elusimicrobiales bacterium]
LYFLTDAVSRRITKADLKIYPLVNKDSKGAFSAKNGEQELEEAKRIAIISSEYSSRVRDYLSARVFDMSSEGWKNAAVFAGINPDTLDNKVKNSGDKALEQSYARATVLNADESSLFIDGKIYDGSPRIHSLFEAINNSLPPSRRVPLPDGYVPPAKKAIPPLYAVLPEGMKKNEQLIRIFYSFFEGIKSEISSYDSVKDKFEWLEFLHSYIFPGTDDVKKTFANFIAAGEFKMAEGKDGQSWVVYEDRNGNGFYPNKPARQNTLELYIMSQCPYGVAAGNLLFGALKKGLLPENYVLELHFIGNAVKNNDEWQFSSLHGENEWKEDARQLYVAKYYPDKLADYVLERNKDITSPDWQTAAKAAGLDVEKIEKGEKESYDMLAADFAIAESLGIGSSPSFISEGRSFFVGLSPVYNLKGMEKLSEAAESSATSVPAGSCN